MSKPQAKYYVFNETRMCFLSLGVTTADTHLARLRGLLGRMRLSNDDGLWLVPCQGIHTFGMLFPIDVIYLDGQYRVIHSIDHLGPFRIAPIRMQSASVLELPPHTIFATGTQAGDQLRICSPEEMQDYWKPGSEPVAGDPAGMDGMEQDAAQYPDQKSREDFRAGSAAARGSPSVPAG